MPFLGYRIWFDPGRNGCDRCGRKDLPIARPRGEIIGMPFGQKWCGPCLRETGR